jgi:hypothetical protein
MDQMFGTVAGSVNDTGHHFEAITSKVEDVYWYELLSLRMR